MAPSPCPSPPKGWRGDLEWRHFRLSDGAPARGGMVVYSENAAAALEILCFALDAIETPRMNTLYGSAI